MYNAFLPYHANLTQFAYPTYDINLIATQTLNL